MSAACHIWGTTSGYTPMKVLQQPAYVLHTRAYRESSLLIELFTRDHGRVAAVAKGVRGKKKVTPPRQFVPSLASWVGRGPLFTLTDCELTPSQGLQGDALACGFYANELLLRLLEPLDVHRHLYEAYSVMIDALENGDSKSVALRRFEAVLLQESGYAPDFTLCAETGAPIDPQAHYELQPELGFVEVTGEVADGQRGYPGTHLTAIYVGDFRTAVVRKTARSIFQQVMQPHLGDRPLASRELLRPVGS